MNTKKWLIMTVILLMAVTTSCTDGEKEAENYASYDDYPVYEGNDLGVTYSPESTLFKIWSPTASEVVVRLYEKGDGGDAIREEAMQKGEKGVWELTLDGDLNGKYYTFQVKADGEWLDEMPGIYAKAVGVNGLRGMILNLDSTDPDGWENDKRPPQKNYTDIVLYEVHVRDFSISPNSGMENKGKFLAFTETGTTNPDGLATGIDHLKEMGVTHVHLLPAFDFRSIDESLPPEDYNYNWGYDPLNYNVPEGTYSTDPFKGEVRINEFKQMVQALHNAGIRVVLDVVYNHTGYTEKSYFNQSVPGYYYRHNEDSTFSNASGCGNETASERPMMRKYMIESIKYWVEEYHLDGFRFDLMGIHDIETMNQIRAAVDEIDESIFIYGEGWTAGASPLPDEQKALKHSTKQLNRIAAFSDDIRDAIKGHWSNEKERGFVSGNQGMEESVKFGIAASTLHPDINYGAVNYSDTTWANEPYQCINYVACHDNHTLWDKLAISAPEASDEERVKMHKLANAIVLTSQGVPFLHAGTEMLRTKQGEHNSFESPDSINLIDWALKTEHQDIVEYYKGLIALRKAHPAFRMPSNEMLQKHLHFSSDENPNVVAYSISDNANGDKWEDILVVFNANRDKTHVAIPTGSWTVVVNDEKVDMNGIETITNGNLMAPPLSAVILVDTESVQ